MARRRERWFPYRIYDPDTADKDATDTHAAGRQKKTTTTNVCRYREREKNVRNFGRTVGEDFGG